MRKHLLFALAAGLLLGADAPKGDAAKNDQEKLQGEWAAVSGERDGNKAPDTELSQVKFAFKGNKLSILIGGKQMEMATIKLDTGPKPATIDLDLTEGPDKGSIAKGIYKLEGDTLTLCVAKPNKERPKEFSAKEGSDCTLLVLKKGKA